MVFQYSREDKGINKQNLRVAQAALYLNQEQVEYRAGVRIECFGSVSSTQPMSLMSHDTTEV